MYLFERCVRENAVDSGGKGRTARGLRLASRPPVPVEPEVRPAGSAADISSADADSGPSVASWSRRSRLWCGDPEVEAVLKFGLDPDHPRLEFASPEEYFRLSGDTKRT